MNEKLPIKNLLKSSLFFIALMLITFSILFKDNKLSEMLAVLAKVKGSIVVVAVSCVFIFISCEGVNIKRILNLLGEECSFIKGLKYAFVGFFFSSVTPSASGGQPMQVYYMNKDGIEISHSSLALLLELASYQFVTLSMAIVGFLLKGHLMSQMNTHLKVLLVIGIIFNGVVLCSILLAIFSKGVAVKLVDLVFAIFSKLKIKKAEAFKEEAYNQIQKYQLGATYIKKNKKVLVMTILTTIVQMTAINSIPFLVYKAFGLGQFSYLSVLSLQSILYIAVSAIPLPGAVGVSESGFMTLFRSLFPAQILASAMLLSRGISFYLFVAISGMAVMLIQILKVQKESEVVI